MHEKSDLHESIVFNSIIMYHNPDKDHWIAFSFNAAYEHKSYNTYNDTYIHPNHSRETCPNITLHIRPAQLINVCKYIKNAKYQKLFTKGIYLSLTIINYKNINVSFLNY